MELLKTIGSILAIVVFPITIFMWFNIGPQKLANFFIAKRKTIFKVIYITVISAFTIFYIVIFAYITVTLNLFSLQWALLWAIVVFSTMGLWSPMLMSRRVWRGRYKIIMNWFIIAFSIFILVGFWIISWSTDLIPPSILTGLLVITLLAYYFHKHWNRIQTKTIQCWRKIRTSIQKGQSP